ncbi:uncharacterized protein LOC123527980 [Mercenaria mercenaria]|uniref:uncharacterized protein LOC123527980 n=1 Tax=Mercenaria mercenaria TaxID=6596 RepID=UPI00234EC1CC|nr:uncharacterized protein LOC123527980 [Mercenaria mercenaria]
MSKGFWTLCVMFFIFSTHLHIGYSDRQDEENVLMEADKGTLTCYFCRGMGPDNDCEKFEPYKDARDAADAGRQHDGPVILKKCSSPFNKSCIIETYANNNGEVAHVRDCSDDKTFDFTEIATNISSYSRLLGLRDNNETACTYDGQNMVCLSKCGHSENYTDFCNGPQFGSTDMTSFSKILFLTITFCYILLYP